MDGSSAIIKRAYSAFNRRDIDGAFAVMADDVRWPKASEGGTVVGKDAVRAYWTRQWSEFDPHVSPLEIRGDGDGSVRVRVHQRVSTVRGELLFDGEVVHVFTVSGGLITAMDLDDDANGGPSAAFGQPGSR